MHEVLASTSRIGHEDPPTAVSTTASQRGTPFVLPASSPYYPTGMSLPERLAARVPHRAARPDARPRSIRTTSGFWSASSRGNGTGISTERSQPTGPGRASATSAEWSTPAELSSAFATGLLNPFGPSGPEGDALLAASEVRGLVPRIHGADPVCRPARVRELTVLPGGPLGIALGSGGAAREPRRRQDADRLRRAQRHRPAAPKQGSRRVQAAYVEIVAPLAKGFEIQARGARRPLQ